MHSARLNGRNLLIFFRNLENLSKVSSISWVSTLHCLSVCRTVVMCTSIEQSSLLIFFLSDAICVFVNTPVSSWRLFYYSILLLVLLCHPAISFVFCFLTFVLRDFFIFLFFYYRSKSFSQVCYPLCSFVIKWTWGWAS